MKSFLKNIAIALVLSSLPFLLQAQAKNESEPDPTGFLSLGARNCVSIFYSGGKPFVGTGAGGQFAYRIGKNFNCHWFTDWIVSNINDLAQRDDLHGGFNMMPTVLSPRVGTKRLSLFPFVGICLDYSRIFATTGKVISGQSFVERYSMAMQAGIGATYPVSNRLDVSLEVHYMLHIGTCVGIDLYKDNEVRLTKMKPGGNLCTEGHYIFAISMDYKMFRLWRKK